jgi:hypothetical protein
MGNSSYGPIYNRQGWFYFGAYNVVTCPNVVWAALIIGMTIDGIPMPPVDVQSPFYEEFYLGVNGHVYGFAYATYYCSQHGLVQY